MTHTTIRAQRGHAAVEFALLMFFLIGPLYTLLLLPHFFWQYNVLRGTAATAARYLAMQSPLTVEQRKPIALKLIQEMTRDAGITLNSAPTFECNTPSTDSCESNAIVSVEVVLLADAPALLAPLLDNPDGISAKSTVSVVR